MRLLVASALLLGFSFIAGAQSKDMNVEVENFFLQSFSDKGAVQWKLNGERSRQLSAFELDLQILRMTLFGANGDKTNLKTKHCLFDKKSGKGGSRSDVEVKSPRTVMTGSGYDFNLKTKTIFIRSDVKVVWSLPSKSKGKKK